jgi:glycosyltransferase involved in cell wall biosynthesis
MDTPLSESGQLPLVSIVTPSYNMAEFLEEAIQSVLSQDYPNIDYIVMDGGSTDGTLDILSKYEGRLRYRSQQDRGQTDAINNGFLLSSGPIFAFLCADDALLPGAVSTAVRHLLANPGYAGVYGEGYLIDGEGTRLFRYPTREFDIELFKADCPICQPAVFLWRDVFADVGMLDVTLQCGLDYDLWIRMAKRNYALLRVDEYLANSRMHQGAKTLSRRAAVFKASINLAKKYYGYAPYTYIYGYCAAVLDRRDGFFEPVSPSLAKYCLSLLYGSLRNPRHLVRYWKEWFEQGSPRVAARLGTRSSQSYRR